MSEFPINCRLNGSTYLFRHALIEHNLAEAGKRLEQASIECEPAGMHNNVHRSAAQ